MEKQSLGSMIAGLRKEKGLTQAVLAEKMGVTDKAVSKWERDLSCPDIASLPRLAELFGISVDDLMQSGFPGPTPGKLKQRSNVFVLVCKAVSLAMGISVAVLSLLKEIDIYSGFLLLGIGLACMAVTALQPPNQSNGDS